MILRIIAAVHLFMATAGIAGGQTFPPNQAGVSMGQIHYHVSDLEAHRRFWLRIGAEPVMLDDREVMKLPGVIVFLTEAGASGGFQESVMAHVGFRVPNTLRMLDRLKVAGYRTELSSSRTGMVGSVYSPDGEKVEFLQDQSVNVKFVPDEGAYEPPPPMKDPIELHHIHYYVPRDEVTAIRDWYVKVFGAVPGRRHKTSPPAYHAGDLPGVNLNFTGVDERRLPTRGRRLDHVGFEIENLEAFCERLESMGVVFDRPYTEHPSGLANAYFSDPWGVYIELTEGLDRLQSRQ